MKNSLLDKIKYTYAIKGWLLILFIMGLIGHVVIKPVPYQFFIILLAFVIIVVDPQIRYYENIRKILETSNEINKND